MFFHAAIFCNFIVLTLYPFSNLDILLAPSRSLCCSRVVCVYSMLSSCYGLVLEGFVDGLGASENDPRSQSLPWRVQHGPCPRVSLICAKARADCSSFGWSDARS